MERDRRTDDGTYPNAGEELEKLKDRVVDNGSKPPNLAPSQIERLAVVMEECGELVQAAGKILRHGYDSKYPGANNRADLAREAADVLESINMLLEAEDISSADVQDCIEEKHREAKKYLHHQS